jgi:formate-dependent nitrite reductase membrane component NrfD
MWSWPIIGYLFLAGLGAGAIAVSACIVIFEPDGVHKESFLSAARLGAYIGPLPVLVGTFLLIFELGRPFRAFNIMTSNIWHQGFNPSPMNWGGWFILLFSVFAILYLFTFLPWRRFFKGALGAVLEDRLLKLRSPLAFICAPLAVAMAVYTAILLAAVPSRPLWHTPVLWMLFTVSAMSTGIAAIMLAQTLPSRGRDRAVSRDHADQAAEYALAGADALLLLAEIVIIGLFIMYAHMTIHSVNVAIGVILPGGQLYQAFWVGVVLIGLLIPIVVEIFYLLRKLSGGGPFHMPFMFHVTIPVAILFGGLVLRYVIVVGGQVTGPVGI